MKVYGLDQSFETDFRYQKSVRQFSFFASDLASNLIRGDSTLGFTTGKK